jgi:Ca-activated chloride channel family protein
MRFAEPWWLLGTGTALLVAALLVWGGFALVNAIRRFGEPERVSALVTEAAGKRRAAKGVLVVFATALAFLAMAQPQYGRGTRLIPATNLDVVVVLDYSKSMYARDVAPSRIARAKAEVARLVKDLPGARFAAVAFAGEPIGFPLTSDGMAIAQFFRQLEPNDMPVGGTAIGRALNRANELLSRDPKARDHRRVIVLITDGEDLEGSPVSVAKSIGESGTTIHVVQIGSRTPEPVPEVDATGSVMGNRRSDDGQPLMTALSSEGEEQLVSIAEAAGGTVVRSERGATGIDVLAQRLEQMMESELSEKVETLYADVYFYPLGLALLLLVIETFVGQARKRKVIRVREVEPRRLPVRARKGTVGHA